MRLTKTGELDRTLYPDILRAGGLGQRIQEALRAIGSQVVVAPDKDMPFFYARVESGGRWSQVKIAAEERLFLADFWSDGVRLADLSITTPEDLVAAIEFWVCARPAQPARPNRRQQHR
jgi:hypothetical protein